MIARLFKMVNCMSSSFIKMTDFVADCSSGEENFLSVLCS